jgi:hypothetical protein
MRPWIVTGAAAVALAAALPAMAGFAAADLIYIPVASHSPGAVGSQWRTDLYITNVDDVAIDIAMVYMPSGLFSNTYRLQSRDVWLGGRESDSFGFVNESLADIPPNGTVVLREIVGEYWVSEIGESGNGALIIAAYEADTLEPDGSRGYKNAIVNARIYNETTIWVEDEQNPGTFVERPAQYGQDIPGVPWYNLADGGAVGETYDLSFEQLTGGEEGGALRYNVGVFNASDALTSLTVRIQPYRPDGEPYLDENDAEILSLITMPPLSHLQLFRPFRDDWGLEDEVGASVRVSIAAWSSLSPNPIPMLTSYGSVVVNNTNDPTSVLPSFADPYDIECMWGGGGEGVKGVSGSRRPIEIPSLEVDSRRD